jgi:general secretion pathway protein M
MNRFSPFTRRFLALVLLLAAVYLPYVLVVAPILAEYQAVQAEIDENRDLVRRYRTIAAERGSLEEELSLAQHNIFPSQYYLAGENPALVAATLQNQIKTFVESTGGKLLSTQILPPQVEQESTRIAVRVRLTGNLEAFYKTLYAIESNRPALFIDTVDINVRREPMRRQQDAEQSELMAGYDVYGYLQPR